MPVTPTYPGVYIEEIPSGVRTITGVATSIAAFVDSFRRGPLNEAVQLFSMTDFETEFGGLDTNSQASYGIQQFFQNGGSEAWAVRVATLGDSSDPANNAEPAHIQILNALATPCFDVRAGRRIRGEIALNPGEWGNDLYIDLDYDTSDPDNTFNLIVSEIRTANGRRSVVRTETFRNLILVKDAPNYALSVVNETSHLVQIDRDAWGDPPDNPPIRPVPSGTYGDALIAPVPAGPITINFTVQVSGSPLARPVTLDIPADSTYVTLRPLLEAAIRNADLSGPPAAEEAERSLITGATVKIVGGGPSAAPLHYLVLAGRSGSAFDPATMLTFAGAGSLALDVAPNPQQFQLGGGQDGTLPVGVAALTGNLAAKTGIYALEDVDLFNILCIPRAAELDSATDMLAVYQAAESYCEGRRAFLIIDIDKDVDDLDAMQTWLLQNETLRHRNAAVYFPRTFVADPLNQNRLLSIAASGTIAGLYARTDATRGVWKAPAGTDARLRNVQALAYVLTDPQNGALNPLGVNCLRTFPVYSHISWGARTLDGADAIASEWKYIPVRRFTLFLEESLYRGTKWVVFEPNDEPLWAQIRLNIGAFMHNLFRQGAFQGQTPKEAYFVKCDKETTTQNDINLGIVNIVVGFAPLKPAEFVIIKIQQIAGQIQT